LIDAVLLAVAERGAKPVFYRYFADKSDLFLAVGRAVAENVVAEVTAAIDRAPSPREKLEAGIDAYIATIEANPDLYRFVAAHPTPGRQAGEDILGDYASVVGLHASRVIGEFMREAGVDSGAADPWGFGIIGLVRSATDRWLEQPTMSRAALVTYLTDLVWPGLTRDPSRTVSSRRPEYGPAGN
jgi:AcrR family transcriptional regulator